MERREEKEKETDQEEETEYRKRKKWKMKRMTKRIKRGNIREIGIRRKRT